MKNSIVCSALLVSLAAGVASVSGQDLAKAVRCVPADRGDMCEIRVPRAEVVVDDRGVSFYKISGRETWRRTDVEVKRGQKIEIKASGIVRWAQDGSDWTFVTPDGTRPPHLNYFPHHDAGIGSLIMRIGKAIYAVGSFATIESEDEGFIEFMINDDILADNSGHFLVTVTHPAEK